MIHLSRVLQLSQDGREHDFVFISKTDGHIVSMNNAIVTSSCYSSNTRNIKSLISGQIRTACNILIISFDNVEVFV